MDVVKYYPDADVLVIKLGEDRVADEEILERTLQPVRMLLV